MTTKLVEDLSFLQKALLKLNVGKVMQAVQSPEFTSVINIKNENELHFLFDPQVQDCAELFKCGLKEQCPMRQLRANRIIILLVEAGVDPSLRRHSDNCTPIQMAVRRPYVATYSVLKMLASPLSTLTLTKEFRCVSIS
jgi:hypothetical protein